MNDKLPQITVRQMIRALERDGWYPKRSTGSHQHFAHRGKPGLVTVPLHSGRDLRRSVVRSILAQAALTEDELKELL